MDIEKVIGELTQAQEAFEKARAEIQGDVRLSPQGRAEKYAELSAKYDAALSDKQSAAHEFVQSELRALSDELDRLTRAADITPRDVTQWQEANARAQFVREDCEQLAVENAPALVAEYERAVKGGDKIAAYLIKRYGRPALSVKGEPGEASGKLLALRDLNKAIAQAEAVDVGKVTPLQEKSKRLSRARLDLLGFVSSKHSDEKRRQYSGSF